MEKIAVIGSGFAGISAAACLAQKGYEVTVFEKNESAGGRARKFEFHGFIFDMGPSWYWMPDVFEKFFHRFGKKVSDYYTLERLDPSYRVFYPNQETLDIPAGIDALCELFEKVEPGSSGPLRKFIAEGKYKYEVGINELVYKPGLSVKELLDFKLIKGLFKLHVFQSVSAYIKKYFKDQKLIQLLEFPVLFLGAPADKTPALYTLMNYADMALGTWYPKGGMFKIVDAMVAVAKEQGVKFEFDSPVTGFELAKAKITGLKVRGEIRNFDYVIAGADYNHIEQNLLPKSYRRYTEAYWENRVMAPSSLIFYLGVNKRLGNLLHHNLFFDHDFVEHAKEIYENQQWPGNPLFYVCCPSKSDTTVAPEGHENIFILIPVAPGLIDDENTREKYYQMVMTRIERLTGQPIKANVIYKRSYAHNDFIADYHAFKGNAYGLANTIRQTANLKPSIINNKVKNLFFTGQLTVPGPGVPPSLISGQVVADELIKRIAKDRIVG